MVISLEGKLSLSLALLLGIGTGVVIVSPIQLWIGWTMIGVSAFGLVLLGGHHIRGLWVVRHRPNGLRKVIAFLGMVISGVCFAGFAAAYFWTTAERGLPIAATPSPARPNDQSRHPLSMREVYDSDFPDLARIFLIQSITDDEGATFKFPASEYLELQSNSYLLTFYITADQPAAKLSIIIAYSVDGISKNLGQIGFQISSPASEAVFDNATMKFSRQVYIYYEKNLSIQEKYEIDNVYRALGYDFRPREAAYHSLHWREFDRVPHAAEDDGQIAAQLPKGEAGSQIRVINATGSLPPTTTTTVPFGSLPVPTPPTPSAGGSPQ